MEKNRLAQLEQGKANLQALRDNADYTRRAEERNFQIQQQNLQADLVQSQLDARTAQSQADVNTQAAKQIFGSLVGFSKTAAELANERAVLDEKREIESGTLSALLNPNYANETWFKNLETEQLIATEQWEGAVNIQEAQGGDTLATAQARFGNPGVTYFAGKGQATVALSTQTPIMLDTIINSGAQFELNGEMVSFSQAPSNPEIMGIAVTLSMREVIRRNGLQGLEDQYLLPGLKAAYEHGQGRVAKARETYIKNTYAMRADQLKSIPRNNTNGMALYGATTFRALATDPNIGYDGAHKWLQGEASAMNADGEFIHKMEDIGNLVLNPKSGKTFEQEWPNRYLDVQEARTKARIDRDKLNLQVDDIAYKQDVKRIMDGLAQDPTQANANAAVQYFVDNHQGQVPSELLRFESSYTVEAKQKEEAIKKLEAIPPGLVTREAVDAAYAVDPTAGANLQKRLQAQEARYNAGIYKETAESFKATANGVTSFGTNKPNTPSSVFLQERMKAVYRQRVDQAVAGGMDFNQAATTIGQALDAEVKAGARDPNSQWYRKADSPGGAAQFPNLNKGSLPALERANRRYEELKNSIRTNGLQATIDTKNSIITAEEAPSIVQNYGKPGFSIPQDVLAVSGMSNGLDPMVIINRQLAQHGIAPLQPPPSLSTVSQTVSPAFQKLLYKSPSVNRSARALGSTNMFNPTLVPGGHGQVVMEVASEIGLAPAMLAAVVEIESSGNAGAISPTGSKGLTQINPDYHQGFFQNNDWRDPRANARYGGLYFKQQLQKYGDPVAAAMAYNGGPPYYDAYLRGEVADSPKLRQMLDHGKKFAKAMYKYGGATEALSNPALMRQGSPLQSSALMRTPARALQSFSPQVSSITFDTGQPGIDVFFEDKQFPAVLPGVVKDISFQGGQGRGYGNYVVIESLDPETNQTVDVLYAHLASKPNLRPGQTVRIGQIIGQQGGTGRVVSADGTIASIDFLRPAPRGSKDMTPYANYDSLRRRLASQLRS
jgi:hypothetical protein